MPLFYKLFILFFLYNQNLFASETGYEVELIIFEDARGRYLNSEDWSYNDTLNNTEKKEIREKAAYHDPNYKTLVWSGAKLEKNLDRLLKNKNYKVLVNKRWKQTGLGRNIAFEIPVSTKPANTDLPTETSYIEGYVKLIMSRYLHFGINLQYIRPQFDENNQLTMKSYPVVSERRMRSREIHYIDHPMIGVVVLATPYKIKTKSDEIKTKPDTYKTL